MRTTVRLDEDLMARVKRRAAESGRTLTAFIEDALRAALAQRPATKARRKLNTYGSKGVLPGIDLDDNRALRDLMDSSDAPL